jgi:cobaltochelatase CobS
MQQAYNQTDGRGLTQLRAKLARCEDDSGDEPGLDTNDTIETSAASNGNGYTNGNGHATNGNGHASDDASELLNIVSRIAGKSLSIEQVSAIIDSKLAAALKDHKTDAAPRLDIATNNIVTATIEGYVHQSLPELIAACSVGLPVFLAGGAGGGKTTAMEQVATALGLPFYIQGAVSGTHELLGYKDAAGAYHTTPFRQAYEHGGVMGLDELDAGDAGALLVLNAALANGHMAFPDNPLPVKRHPDFRCIAAGNTYGQGADRQYVGRNQMDAALLDRFYFMGWDYDHALELALCGETGPYNDRHVIKPVPRAITAAMSSDWCNRVQRLRGAIQPGDRLIISPRASLMGIKALSAGLNNQQVENALVWKGCKADVRRRIEISI